MKKLVFVLLAASLVSAIACPRDSSQRYAFVKQHPCPATQKTKGACPGYVVDHIIPLACGGPDTPSNTQWQTTADAKAKDKWERKGCQIKALQAPNAQS